MRKRLFVLLVGSIWILLCGCTTSEGKSIEEHVLAVKVDKIIESENGVHLNYMGTVDSENTLEYCFKSAGRLSKVYVKEGDHIKKGDRLLELDIQDLTFQLNASKGVVDTAALNITKAKEGLNYQKDLFSKIEKLYQENAISKDQYDQAKLQLDVSQTNYNQTITQCDTAKTDYEYKESLLKDAFIDAKHDGSVVKVLYDEGELVPQGHPVIITRNTQQVINIGIAQQDLSKIKIGSKALINVDGEKAEGYITNIAEAPDSTTRTYNAEVSVEKDFRLGLLAKVSLEVGAQKGIWIPMTAILSNGEDFVYVVQKNRVLARPVIIKSINENRVLVDGLSLGEVLVTGGMKNIYDGAKVKISNQEIIR